ncbi:MAG: histidinol-phosphate transaminase [Burkholderiaceae bacterium]|nr:histidinol-phosphate transaminase [Burkholderiaceae bacterium]
MSVEKLARGNIQRLVTYPTFNKVVKPEDVWLNFNEYPESVPFELTRQEMNRYPDPQPRALVESYARYAGVKPENVIVTRGGDEGIELVIRAFCEPREDAIIICPPTYGMYEVSADTLGVECKKVATSKENGWQLNVDAIEQALDRVKVIFICSPNNPTGQLIDPQSIRQVLEMARDRAVVVVDEAYIEFCPDKSVVSWLADYPHMAIIRTLSKAFALAGLRCGFVLGNAELIEVLTKTLPPYAVPSPVEDIAVQALDEVNVAQMRARVKALKENRAYLLEALTDCPNVEAVFGTEANFVLVQFKAAQQLFDDLKKRSIFIRNQSTQVTLDGCLRISVGTRQECERVIAAIKALA